MNTSLIFTAFDRAHLLKWNFESLIRQEISFDYEILILNDGLPDETEKICNEYSDKLNIRYIFTGKRNLGKTKENILWRVPAFALNIGVKQSKYENIILGCAEMYCIGNEVVKNLSEVLDDNPRCMVSPMGKSDRGTFLINLQNTNGKVDMSIYKKMSPLNTSYPFFMALKKKEYIDIGGYDEDFTGIYRDDVDFTKRMRWNKCRLLYTEDMVIHLHHARFHHTDKNRDERRNHNIQIYESRKGIIKRNQDREWGVL